MAVRPNYAAVTSNGELAQVSVANTNRDGTGALADVLIAGASGARVDRLVLQATGTSTAGMLRLFVAEGATVRLIGEVPVVAVTPSATIPAWQAAIDFTPALELAPGNVLKASTHNAETFNVIPTSAGGY